MRRLCKTSLNGEGYAEYPECKVAFSEYIKQKVRDLPHKPGVYLMRDRFGKILYIGKAKDLKSRVSTYFQSHRRNQIQQHKIAAMIPLICDFDLLEVRSEAEALLLEAKLIKQWKPKYNTDFVDDKRFLMVRVDVHNPLPKFRLTRIKTDTKSRYFGPFVQANLLKRTLYELRRKFGVLLSDARPKRLPDGKVQLYEDARAELYTSQNILSIEDYQKNVDLACKVLEGKSVEYLSEVENKMERAATEMNYEKAALWRDVAKALRKTVERSRKFVRDPESTLDFHTLGIEVQKVLGLPVFPKIVECFDISHISGSFVVASMVFFKNGKPDKKEHRRYKIREKIGNDDYQSMLEVVSRRYKRLHQEEKTFPNLVVIDGGLGQVSSAVRAFWNIDTEPPPIIGLAKKDETVIFSEGRSPLNLPLHHPVIRFLQRVRDEAHRYANTFNADLRSKKIRESVLDDFPGLGKSKKEALLNHFGNIQKVRKANIDDFIKIDGIGYKTATSLKNFLNPKGNNF